MAEQVVVWRGSRASLDWQLARVPLLLTANAANQLEATRIARALGMEMLAIIREAYLQKARGDVDAAGIRWQPLSPRTIAYQRRHPGLNRRRAGARAAGRASRPLLTAQQDRLWRGVYASCLKRGDEPATAAAKAWATVKRAGGQTILGRYSNTQVEIGRDTGRLLASLSPGAPDAILDATPGAVRVGTNVTYAAHFHARRPLWPADPARFPQAWLDRLADMLARALAQAAARLLGGA